MCLREQSNDTYIYIVVPYHLATYEYGKRKRVRVRIFHLPNHTPGPAMIKLLDRLCIFSISPSAGEATHYDRAPMLNSLQKCR